MLLLFLRQQNITPVLFPCQQNIRVNLYKSLLSIYSSKIIQLYLRNHILIVLVK